MPVIGSSCGGASFAAMALIGMLLPSAYGLMAGYQFSQLQIESKSFRSSGRASKSRKLACSAPNACRNREDAGLHRSGSRNAPCIWSRRTISRSR